MDEFLAEIGLEDLKGNYNEDNVYVIELKDSNHYAKIFSKLDKCDSIHEIIPDDITMSFEVISYENEQYNIDLISDFDDDKYRLEISEKVEF